MTEPTIICPHCKTEIKLTESLAAPLIAAGQALATDLRQRHVCALDVGKAQ